jgi:hypothetical protein
MAELSHKAEPSGLAVGVTIFAAAMLMLTGTSQALTGLAAVVNDAFLVRVGGYLYAFDASTWGWIHLVLGAGLVTVGVFILYAKPWAFVVGIILAAVNCLLNFLWLPASPLWAIVLIGLNVLVIWALSTTRNA